MPRQTLSLTKAIESQAHVDDAIRILPMSATEATRKAQTKTLLENFKEALANITGEAKQILEEGETMATMKALLQGKIYQPEEAKQVEEEASEQAFLTQKVEPELEEEEEKSK